MVLLHLGLLHKNNNCDHSGFIRQNSQDRTDYHWFSILQIVLKHELDFGLPHHGILVYNLICYARRTFFPNAVPLI